MANDELLPSFELGVTRLFGNGDIGLAGRGGGWAEPEDNHCWNEGGEAVMVVKLPRLDRACRVEFEGLPFINTKSPSQDVILYINGFRIASWHLTEDEPQMLSATVEPEQFFVRKEHAVAKCVWVLPNSSRPSDLSLNSDIRQLGFCFRSLTFSQAD